jgi:hypothetical protein
VIGLGHTSGIVAAVCLAGAVVTVALLPEPKGRSLEELTESGSQGRRAVREAVSFPARGR